MRSHRSDLVHQVLCAIFGLRRMMAYDRRLEPRVGERVPYVIVYGIPGVPLIQLVRRPMEVLQEPSLRLNATYYITKQILPPLARMFQLIGVDVFSWYQELPRVRRFTFHVRKCVAIRIVILPLQLKTQHYMRI